MHFHRLTGADWTKAIAIGIGVAILTAGVMLIGLRTGVSPLPRPLALAFVQTLVGGQPPMPVGFLFHAVWVTFFSVLYVGLFRPTLTFLQAFWLAFVLWVLVLVFFFPVVGWGFLGLEVSPKLIAVAAVSHLLFAILLWAFCRLAFHPRERSTARGPGGHAA